MGLLFDEVDSNQVLPCVHHESRDEGPLALRLHPSLTIHIERTLLAIDMQLAAAARNR